MSAPDLSTLGAGFSEPVFASQRIFRGALEALSRPGRIVTVESDAQAPQGLHAAACALALTLLDQDTRLWRSRSLDDERIGTYVRFHTGCLPAGAPRDADLVLCTGTDMPHLSELACGSGEYPDRSATLIVQVEALETAEAGWRLSGPGIRSEARLAVAGLRSGFLSEWKANAALYPCGVDVFLACGALLCGLPRTTRVEA